MKKISVNNIEEREMLKMKLASILVLIGITLYAAVKVLLWIDQ